MVHGQSHTHWCYMSFYSAVGGTVGRRLTQTVWHVILLKWTLLCITYHYRDVAVIVFRVWEHCFLTCFYIDLKTCIKPGRHFVLNKCMLGLLFNHYFIIFTVHDFSMKWHLLMDLFSMYVSPTL